jgi:hypothetical protein
MRTAFRAKVYHAENPLSQPEPVIAARKIIRMLTGDASSSDLVVNFRTVFPE